MPFDGSGNYTRVHDWTDDRDAGIKILASRMDAEMDDQAAAFNMMFFRNGLIAMAGNLNLGVNTIYNVGAGTLGAPAFRFAGDANTGFFLNGVGKLALVAGGTNRLEAGAAGVAVTGTLGVSGAATLSSTLGVTGNATVGGTLGVTGNTSGPRFLTGNGLVSAPGFAFSGDPDTGIYQGGLANELIFACGGVSRMTVGGTGVGIDTGAPINHKLGVNGSVQLTAGSGVFGSGSDYLDFSAGTVPTSGANIRVNAIGGPNPSGIILYRNALTEVMRTDGSTGNVGIAMSNPVSRLHIAGGSAGSSSTVGMMSNASGSATVGTGVKLVLSSQYANDLRGVSVEGVNSGGANNAHDLVLSASPGSSVPVERMRMHGTNSGNTIFGNGPNPISDLLAIAGSTPAQFGVAYSVPAGVVWSAGGTTEFILSRASGVAMTLLTDSGNDAVIHFGDEASESVGRIAYAHTTNNMTFRTNGTERIVINSGGSLYPSVDNAQACGISSNRWSVIYAVNGTIQTSDERSKQDIEAIPDEWLDAWGAVDWQRYKFKDAVERGGARWHTGLVAQRIRDAFAERGLDATDIGLLCYDEWGDRFDIEDGQIRQTQVAGDRWGLRYDECFAMEAAYQRRRMDRIEARLAALEAA